MVLDTFFPVIENIVKEGFCLQTFFFLLLIMMIIMYYFKVFLQFPLLRELHRKLTKDLTHISE